MGPLIQLGRHLCPQSVPGKPVGFTHGWGLGRVTTHTINIDDPWHKAQPFRRILTQALEGKCQDSALAKSTSLEVHSRKWTKLPRPSSSQGCVGAKSSLLYEGMSYL